VPLPGGQVQGTQELLRGGEAGLRVDPGPGRHGGVVDNQQQAADAHRLGDGAQHPRAGVRGHGVGSCGGGAFLWTAAVNACRSTAVS